MNNFELTQTLLLFAVLLLLVRPVGSNLARVYQGERTFHSPLFLPCENLLYRICRVNRDE